jgi:hypothetical protein
MSEADATLARLLEADRRFTEFSKQHLACGGLTLAGDRQVTIFRCLICGEVFAMKGLALQLYVDYLREFKGAADLDR